MADQPAQLIDCLIAELGDWRGEKLAQLRKLILEASPEIREEWKWNTAVWTQNGLICSAAAFKEHLKLNMTLDVDDIKELPVFTDRGGLTKFKKVFADNYDALIKEINLAIAA